MEDFARAILEREYVQRGSVSLARQLTCHKLQELDRHPGKSWSICLFVEALQHWTLKRTKDDSKLFLSVAIRYWSFMEIVLAILFIILHEVNQTGVALNLLQL